MRKHDGDVPTCVECIHYAENFCHSDDCSQFDNVEGRRPVTAATARDARMNTCGPAAKFFEQRPAPSWLDRNASLLGMGALGALVVGMLLSR